MTTLMLQDIDLHALRCTSYVDIFVARHSPTTALGLAEPPGDERPALASVWDAFGREGYAHTGAFLFTGESK
jgi:hypothetical protein